MPTPYITVDEKNCDERQEQIQKDIEDDIATLSAYEYDHLQCLLLLSQRLRLINDAIKRHGEM